jgi:PhzF family phenazine biosynthesis protein
MSILTFTLDKNKKTTRTSFKREVYMKKNYNLYQVDAFTTKKFTGNPAGVITNADGLTDKEMQKIARELNNSETAFMFDSISDKYDVHTRYFTPTDEVPICGHATIASQYVRAIEHNLNSTRVLNKTGAGILPVDIEKIDNDYKISMTQGKIEFGTILVDEYRQILLDALGICEKDMIENFNIQIVSTGHSKVMVGIKSLDTLHRLNPDSKSLSELSKKIGCNGFYVFTLSPDDKEYLVNGRMFAPAIGIEEDPVTGNANGPLGAYLVKYKLVTTDNSMLKFKAIQGEAMNRKGTIEVNVKIENNEPVQVKVVGTAIIAFESKLQL